MPGTNSIEYQASWRAKNRQHYNELFAKYRLDPEFRKRNNARNTVNNAIRDGRLKRGNCKRWGCKIIGEAHHEDYDKPLDVIWLCKKHHEQYHKESS